MTLYRRMTGRWLDRDQRKHRLRREDKLTLAMHLAAHLVREGGGRLPVRDLERWLLRWIDSAPDLRLRYRDPRPDQLKEDLRTAAFLVRDDDAGGGFRFAYTSLLEYFLAEYLLAAVREGAPERWDLPMPSLETLDSLGQLLADAPPDAPLDRPAPGWT